MYDEKPKRTTFELNTHNTPTWAYILIGVGVIWLLANLGLFAWWPLLLIVFGYMALKGKPTAIETHHLTAPLENADSARIQLTLPVGCAKVAAMNDSTTLIDANITHMGEVEFNVSGEDMKSVVLKPGNGTGMAWLNPANWLNSKDTRWDIGLNKNVPLNLSIQGSVGEAHADLTGLQLTHVEMNGGIGDFDLVLPASESAYEAQASVGTGDLTVNIASGAAVDLSVKGGIGDFNVHTPLDAAVRIKANMSIGDIDIPSRFVRINRNDGMMSKSGVWETLGFEDSANQITIEFNGALGDFSVR